MTHTTRVGRVWVFDEGSLEQALAAYQTEALTAYPHQAERIGTAVAAIRDFLHSSHADPLTLGKGESGGKAPGAPV